LLLLSFSLILLRLLLLLANSENTHLSFLRIFLLLLLLHRRLQWQQQQHTTSTNTNDTRPGVAHLRSPRAGVPACRAAARRRRPRGLRRVRHRCLGLLHSSAHCAPRRRLRECRVGRSSVRCLLRVCACVCVRARARVCVCVPACLRASRASLLRKFRRHRCGLRRRPRRRTTTTTGGRRSLPSSSPCRLLVIVVVVVVNIAVVVVVSRLFFRPGFSRSTRSAFLVVVPRRCVSRVALCAAHACVPACLRACVPAHAAHAAHAAYTG
jgi:hypothetical protein